METTAAINKNWSLCTVASFIGCTIVILFFNQGQNSLNLLVSKMGLFDPRNFSGGKNPVNEEENKCNVFDGNWVYDPRTSPLYNASQCPFLSEQVSCQRNGRPDSDYEKWRWEPKGCNIPRFNGTNMLEKLRGKRVILVGDSLNRNQWESLVCLLYSAIPSSRAHIDVSNHFFMAKDYNCSVEFYMNPFLVHLEEKKENGNGSRILRLDKISPSAQKWEGADFMVFDSGHWWNHHDKWDLFQYNGTLVDKMQVESAFESGMRTWANWIDRNANIKKKTTVFFRSLSPEHKGEQYCYKKKSVATQPIMDGSYVYAFPMAIHEIMERIIQGMKTPVSYLNITTLSEYRRDAHPAIYARKQEQLLIAEQPQQPKRKRRPDCTHWCLPGVPDTWNQLLYAAIASESSKDITAK